MAKVAMPLYDDDVPAGYGNIGESVDLTAYRSCVLYFKVTGLSGGTFSVGLYERDEITGTSSWIAGTNFTTGVEGYLRAPVEVLYGTKFLVEWFSPNAGAHVTTGLVALD